MAGERLQGGFTLVRTRGRGGKPQWLLMKRRDEGADAWVVQHFHDPEAAQRKV